MISELELKELVSEILEEILGEEEKKSKVNPSYLKGSPEKKKREKEIRARAKKDTDDPSAYRPFSTDKDPKTGEPIKTEPSKWNKKFEKMFGEGTEELDIDSLREFISEVLLNEKGDSVTKALKNKAEKSGAPMSALRAIYNKGLAAWRTGHRPGASQHAWAMARVNSVLAGGPARKVDAAQWKKIKKHRGKKKK
jgi:hypothetical protein